MSLYFNFDRNLQSSPDVIFNKFCHFDGVFFLNLSAIMQENLHFYRIFRRQCKIYYLFRLTNLYFKIYNKKYINRFHTWMQINYFK